MTEYSLPPAAVKLTDTARNNGWLVSEQWHTNHWDETWVHVIVGRKATTEEIRAFREDAYWGEKWVFEMSWHSRHATRPGTLRLFGKPLGKTPQRPPMTEYTLTQVRECITANPKPDHYTLSEVREFRDTVTPSEDVT